MEKGILMIVNDVRLNIRAAAIFFIFYFLFFI